jgi:site-specific DNA-methyltransferase (adenine-specific)
MEGMKSIPNGSVDLILCDPPYGITDCSWDKALPAGPLFQEYSRVAKENAAIVLFAAQPYATDLINAYRRAFRYELIWRKNKPGNFLNAKRMPLRAHENILVFYKKLPTYNPQKTAAARTSAGRKRGGRSQDSACYRSFSKPDYCYVDDGTRYPQDVLDFPCVTLTGPDRHPTQKPTDLIAYLIRTYSNSGDLVLDTCMGSGTTAVAALREGRRFIGFETDARYCAIARGRIAEQAKFDNQTHEKMV